MGRLRFFVHKPQNNLKYRLFFSLLSFKNFASTKNFAVIYMTGVKLPVLNGPLKQVLYYNSYKMV